MQKEPSAWWYGLVPGDGEHVHPSLASGLWESRWCWTPPSSSVKWVSGVCPPGLHLGENELVHDIFN